MVTEDDLKRLPLRAVVAFAARCARRVQPLYRLPGGHPDETKHKLAVERAISVAESFSAAAFTAGERAAATAYAVAAAPADGADDASAAAVTARNARNAAAAAAYAARAAAAGATDDVYSEALAAAATAYAADLANAADYVRILSLGLGVFPDPGDPVDPSESGPLGPLWPDGAPEWFVIREPWFARAVGASEPHRLVLEAEVGAYADTEEVAAALAELGYALNAYHVARGGNGLVIDDWQIHVPADEPAGVEP